MCNRTWRYGQKKGHLEDVFLQIGAKQDGCLNLAYYSGLEIAYSTQNRASALLFGPKDGVGTGSCCTILRECAQYPL